MIGSRLKTKQQRLRTVGLAAAILATAASLSWLGSAYIGVDEAETPQARATEDTASTGSPSDTAAARPKDTAAGARSSTDGQRAPAPLLPAGELTDSSTEAVIRRVQLRDLIIPVAGIQREQLNDTYNDARSDGRVHNAIDIHAPLGAAVMAAADGTILRLYQSERGGETIYQLDPDGRTVYYYAHLDSFAEGMLPGRNVKRGETIAYVGDTGNATPGNYHLHFEINVVGDPRRFWSGISVNPYPILARK